jgi:hypothetical protein
MYTCDEGEQYLVCLLKRVGGRCEPVQVALESAPKHMDEISPYGLQPLTCKEPGL